MNDVRGIVLDIAIAGVVVGGSAAIAVISRASPTAIGIAGLGAAIIVGLALYVVLARRAEGHISRARLALTATWIVLFGIALAIIVGPLVWAYLKFIYFPS